MGFIFRSKVWSDMGGEQLVFSFFLFGTARHGLCYPLWFGRILRGWGFGGPVGGSVAVFFGRPDLFLMMGFVSLNHGG
jgi:hypothetical protein